MSVIHAKDRIVVLSHKEYLLKTYPDANKENIQRFYVNFKYLSNILNDGFRTNVRVDKRWSVKMLI